MEGSNKANHSTTQNNHGRAQTELSSANIPHHSYIAPKSTSTLPSIFTNTLPNELLVQARAPTSPLELHMPNL